MVMRCDRSAGSLRGTGRTPLSRAGLVNGPRAAQESLRRE